MFVSLWHVYLIKFSRRSAGVFFSPFLLPCAKPKIQRVLCIEGPMLWGILAQSRFNDWSFGLSVPDHLRWKGQGRVDNFYHNVSLDHHPERVRFGSVLHL